jgi:drug/metabolite transporter (DMT)-like permease
MLFKDICFLVAFGMIAVHTTKAAKLDEFVSGTLWFVGAGFVWSFADLVIRGLWSQRDPHEGPGQFAIVWIVLDFVLFLIVLALNSHVGDELHRARWVSGVYVLFLFLDFLAIIRASQSPPAADQVQPDDQAAPAGNAQAVTAHPSAALPSE